MPSPELLEKRRENVLPDLLRKRWYHSFALPDGSHIDGVVSLERLRERVAEMPIPPDLRGKRVLDIGAWDGWFSFEMERRGADVVAVDCVQLDTFLEVHRRLNSRVQYLDLDLFELTRDNVGTFDIVLFLGVLYHLKHPLLGLERVCSLTRGLAIVESFVADVNGPSGMPAMEFYEADELGGQLDNWWGPTTDCLLALCRTAGFVRVQQLSWRDERAAVACFRHWEPNHPSQPAPVLTHAVHHWNYGLNFYTTRDEYVSLWFTTNEPNLTRVTVQPEIGGFAVQSIAVAPSGEGRWLAHVKLPPGLTPGWHEARVCTPHSAWSNALRIAVDIPARTDALDIGGLCDGTTWTSGEVTLADPAFLSLWIKGLPDNTDTHNLRLTVANQRQTIQHIAPQPDENGYRQINVQLANVPPGSHEITARFAGHEARRTFHARTPGIR